MELSDLHMKKLACIKMKNRHPFTDLNMLHCISKFQSSGYSSKVLYGGGGPYLFVKSGVYKNSRWKNEF